jgi:hypothetical protein
MPKQSHRTSAKRRGKKKRRVASGQHLESFTQERLQPSAGTVPISAAPPQQKQQPTVQNPYVAAELKKIGTMAGIVFAILIVLSVTLPHMLG